MFGNKKRPFPFADCDQNKLPEKAKCICPSSKRIPATTGSQYTDIDDLVQSNTESHLDMETESNSNGSNNNEQSEYNRNVHTLQPKQQICRQCLAGQGGHFMHISTDGNNNT